MMWRKGGATIVVWAVCQTVLSAQGRGPVTAFAAGAAADWVSTYRFLNADLGIPEVSPYLKPFNNKPVPTIAVGAAVDVGGVLLWNRLVGRKHPKLAAAGLYTAAAFRFGLAIKNTWKVNIERERQGRR